MAQTTFEILIYLLEDCGVNMILGMAGDRNNGLMESLRPARSAVAITLTFASEGDGVA